MRTSFVNGLALLFFVATSTGACSHADGRAQGIGLASGNMDSLTTKADLGRIQGSPDAKVWVVEVSDFQCPYCKEWHDETYAVVRDEYVKTGKIRLAYVNFPLSQHEHSKQAAQAAMCTAVQGKFWNMQDSLFATQLQWEVLPDPTSYFETLASKVGVNIPTWKACLGSKSIRDLIEADMDRAKRAGVQSTPSFIVGGKLIEGARPPAAMRQAINDALGVKP